MKTAVTGAVLLFGIPFTQACGGKAAGPPTEPSPRNQVERGLPQEEVAGAVSTLTSEEESGGHFATMVDMLRGRVPGLQVSEGASGEITVRIRGDQSILFNGPPLLVVDGVPVPPYAFSSTLRTMNPAEVQSIRVLKDTGSTSAYGTRGAHGVILIRLKRD
jgi:TonB-dependent SusC/RagA subfamily outer membrane receptor